MNSKRRSLSNPCRRGFTLIEMVMSLVILSIILLACGSIVMMATRATRDGATRNLAQMQTADAASQITDDLNVALNFSQRTATAATFTVPDRLNAGSPQTVSYSWSGNPGDPLLRQFNGGTSSALLSGVQNLNLTFTSRLMGPAPGPTEQILFSHATATGILRDNNLNNNNWASQCFVPNLPIGTSSYTLTRVRLMLKAGPQNGVMNVSLRLPDVFFRPTSTIIAQASVYESALSAQYEWIDIPFTGLSNQNPLQPLCIVLTSATGSTNIGAVEIDQSLLSILANAHWSTTNNAGWIWSAGISNKTALFYVYGTVP